jgi:hypothetical protein
MVVGCIKYQAPFVNLSNIWYSMKVLYSVKKIGCVTSKNGFNVKRQLKNGETSSVSAASLSSFRFQEQLETRQASFVSESDELHTPHSRPRFIADLPPRMLHSLDS